MKIKIPNFDVNQKAYPKSNDLTPRLNKLPGKKIINSLFTFSKTQDQNIQKD